ncbi:substrate-binding periplasmic protein [Shewanella gaetbuli]
MKHILTLGIYCLLSIISLPLNAATSVRIMTSDYAPYTSSNAHDSGVVLAIIETAFATQGVSVEYEFAPWKRGEMMVASGKAFGAVPYFKNEQRQQNYDFSDPVIYSVNKFFYNTEKFPDGFTWHTLEDFQGYQMGGILGYWYLPAFKKAGLTVSKVSTDQQNLGMLLLKRNDFTVIDELTGKLLLTQYFPEESHKIAVLEKPESIAAFHVMISRKYPDAKKMAQLLNTGLQQIKASGKYQQILQRYQISSEFAAE